MKSFRKGEPVIVQLRKGGFEYVGKYVKPSEFGHEEHCVQFPATEGMGFDWHWFRDSQIRKANAKR
jgi:hypothetical protein